MTQWFAPIPMAFDHDVTDFDSGEASLDEWLKKRAFKNQQTGASRTFVLCNDKNKVAGYYCLSAGAISHEVAPKNLRRNMPNLLPIILLGRLAIDKQYHNRGLGSGLLRDALIRCVSVASNTRVFALLVHALSEPAKQFYLSRGFIESPLQPMTLMMTLETARAILSESSKT